MPSPIAHITIGAIIASVVARKKPLPRHTWMLPVVCIFFSMAPDLDMIAGILMRDIGSFHNQMSHSPLFGLTACLILTPLVKLLLPGYSLLHVLGLLVLCYGLHLAMDYLTYGRGLKLLWPWAEDRFRSPILLFYGVRWSHGILTPLHFITIANEALFAVICAWILRRMKK